MNAPHLTQYQGSKKKLAPTILQYCPPSFNRLIEPFSGTCSVSIFAAKMGRTESFIINDINEPLIRMMELCVNQPEVLYSEYQKIWQEQFEENINHVEYFVKKRQEFNACPSPALMLFMLSRIVKGAIRYNNNGEMNQSCDKRRFGTNPEKIKKNAKEISELLINKSIFYSLDYKEILEMAEPGDIVYMDPPYQGTSNTRDDRYLQGVNFEDFVHSLDKLNSKNVDFIVSYDGKTGEKKHGKLLPKYLGLTHILLDAGISSQSVLLGKKERTYESLYISKGLVKYLERTD